MVLGAGLFAANLSTTFRLRKFGMKDGMTYPITIEVHFPTNSECQLVRFKKMSFSCCLHCMARRGRF